VVMMADGRLRPIAGHGATTYKEWLFTRDDASGRVPSQIGVSGAFCPRPAECEYMGQRLGVKPSPYP
jgi:hypothetical protein